jgi:hypothetical protein
MRSGRFCDQHLAEIATHVNPEGEAALFAMIAAHLASLHLEPRAETPSRSREARTPGAISPAFSWIHVPDAHFGAGREHWRLDHEAVARAITEDVRRCPWPIDRVFVTGDLAFSGRED